MVPGPQKLFLEMYDLKYKKGLKPASMIIDKQGILRWKSVGNDRPDTQIILTELKKINN